MIGAAGAVVAFPLISQLAAFDWRLAIAVHLFALPFVPLVLALPNAGAPKLLKLRWLRRAGWLC